MLNFLPFNTIRWFFKWISDGKKYKQATAGAIKEAGLNTIGYDDWTNDQFLLYNEIRNEKLMSIGLPESNAQLITVNGMPALQMDTGFSVKHDGRFGRLLRVFIIEDEEGLRQFQNMMVDSKVMHYEIPRKKGFWKGFLQSEPLNPIAMDIHDVNGKRRFFLSEQNII